MLKVWNMVLIILIFSLTIFGTFLARSGVLASVHTFTETPLLGNLFLAFLGITLFGSLILLYYRREGLKSEAEMESLVSRESTFLLNNLLLVGAAFAIFLGTVFPLISEWVRDVKISVGPAFFNQVNGPIFLATILLTGICALIGWRRASTKNLTRNFLWPLVATLVLGIVLFIAGVRQWGALVAFFLCGFVIFTILYEWFKGTRARHRMKAENYLKAFWGLLWANRPRYGGYIVHIAIMLIAIGVVGSSFYGTEKEAVLMPGEEMTISNYNLTYEGWGQYGTPDERVLTAELSIYNGEKYIGRLIPEVYIHRSYQNQTVTEVAIRSTLAEDLYVIPVFPIVRDWYGNIVFDEDGAIVLYEDVGMAFKVLVSPLVSWMWIGGGVLLLGGLIAFWPERRRLPALKTPKTGGK